MNTKTACFTGHRPNKLFGYERDNYLQLVQALTDDINILYNKGYTRFITGGAQGADQLAFWAVNRVKKIHPDVQNIVYVPFKGQGRQWQVDTLFGQNQYALMLEMADSVVYLQEELTVYTHIVKALFERNHRMIDDSDLVFGIYHGADFITETKGGTAECLKYANNKNKLITIIDPMYFQSAEEDASLIEEVPDVIPEFQGKYRFLSNFWDCPVTYNNITYLNAESSYQAQKCPNIAHSFANLSAYDAKKLAYNVAVFPDWEETKLQIMADIVYQKFLQNPELREKLLATGDAVLVEGNKWRDTYWGVCNGVGENWLGRILMQVRQLLKN